VNLARAIASLQKSGFWVMGLTGDAPRTLAEARPRDRRVALVLGAEDTGLRRLQRETCDELVRLPITEAMESLNVAAAAASMRMSRTGQNSCDKQQTTASKQADETPRNAAQPTTRRNSPRRGAPAPRSSGLRPQKAELALLRFAFRETRTPTSPKNALQCIA
jgi:tRNA C32,U32 (ribose-2'-O)-methylase TrmJ